MVLFPLIWHIVYLYVLVRIHDPVLVATEVSKCIRVRKWLM